MFSSRVAGYRATNRLATAVAARRAHRRPFIDLTVTNPTACGIRYPDDLLTVLSDPRGHRYQPEAFGLRDAREAVAADYARRGTAVARQAPDAARIVLTASTSEAYSLLFKLLTEPSGDEVLVPVPSYPLFDHLTRLDGVGVRSYALEYHGQWHLDAHSLDSEWTDRIRAVLAVSPNNPTGSVLSPRELDTLAVRCADREAALIVDEVFADYALGEGHRALDAASTARTDALTFRLGGLSKSAGLPQVKLGWILVEGPDALVDDALARLELICDTYLSVSTPVQVAAAELMARGAPIRAQIQARIQENYAAFAAACAARPAMELLRADGGWSAVVRVPATMSEEDLVLELLEHAGVLVHPGFFFDFPHEAFLVLSLLPDPAAFAEGLARLMEHVDA